MWFAIALTVFAATGNNIGKALQKEAVHGLPRFSLHPRILQEYLRSRLWLTGLAADLGGALLMVAAFALAPVSLVQPVSGLGLVSLAVFSHFHLKERLALEEWAAVAMSMLGTIGLGVSSDDSASSEAAAFGLPESMGILTFVAILVLLVLYGRRLNNQKRKSATGVRLAASFNGLQAGICFGLSAASCKAGIIARARVGWASVPLGLAASTLLSSLGFMLQTLGLKDGNTVVVCTCAAVASMASGVLVGLLAMGESLPTAWDMKLLRLLSWLVTMAGVSALANGKGGFAEVVRFVVALIPKHWQARTGIATWSTSESKLPVTGQEEVL